MLWTDEVPYAEKRWDDETAWGAVYKATKAQTVEKYGPYRDAMNFSLVFVRDYVFSS